MSVCNVRITCKHSWVVALMNGEPVIKDGRCAAVCVVCDRDRWIPCRRLQVPNESEESN